MLLNVYDVSGVIIKTQHQQMLSTQYHFFHGVIAKLKDFNWTLKNFLYLLYSKFSLLE